MPVDLFTPTLVALAFIGLPIVTALRGTAWAFAGLCLIELAAACCLYAVYFRGIRDGSVLAIAMLVYVGPQIIGLGIMALRARPVRSGRASRCSACGYDLRATPERCPECGTVPPTAR